MEGEHREGKRAKEEELGGLRAGEELGARAGDRMRAKGAGIEPNKL